MSIPSIEFGADCDVTSLYSVLFLINSGRRAEGIGDGTVFDFVLKDGRVFTGAYAGDDDGENIEIALWRDAVVYTEEKVTIPTSDIARIIYQ